MNSVVNHMWKKLNSKPIIKQLVFVKRVALHTSSHTLFLACIWFILYTFASIRHGRTQVSCQAMTDPPIFCCKEYPT